MSKSNAASKVRQLLKTQNAATISITPTPKKPTPPPKHISVKEIAQEPNLEQVVQKINEAATQSIKFRNRHNIYDLCISRLARNRRYNLIVDVVESHKKLGDITDEGFALRLLSFYAKAGMFDNARKLFDELPELGCGINVKLFNALLKAALVGKRFDEISRLSDEIPNKFSIELNVVSYNIRIHAICEMGLLDKAMLVLVEMEENGVKPNLVTFHTLLDAFNREKEFEGGDRIWGMMDYYNVVRDTRSYNLRMQGLINDGKVKEAVAMFEALESKGSKPDVTSFNVFIKKCCDQGELEEAKKYYNALLESGCTANSITFSTLVPKLCDNGDFSIAFGLCKKMFNRQFVVDNALLQLVVDGLLKVSMTEEAKELVELGKSNVYVQYDLVLPTDDGVEKDDVEKQVHSI